MSKILAMIFVLILPLTNCYSQAEFNHDGMLIGLKAPDNIITRDDKGLREMNDTGREHVRKLLLQKVDDAIDAIHEGPTTSRKFYEMVFGNELRNVSNELQTLKDLLSNEDVASFDVAYKRASLNGIAEAATTIKDIIYHTETYQLPPGKDNKASFTQTELLNLFLIRHYNNTLIDFKSMNLTIDRLREIDDLLIRNKHRTDSMVHLFRATRSDTERLKLYCDIKKYEEESDTELAATMKLLKDNAWFKKWFWIRGGEMKLNPLDFTAAEFINANPEYDVTKANIFNQYIDSLLGRYIRRDSTQRIAEFKNILGQRGTGKEVFSFKDRIDALQSKNEVTKSKLQAVTTTLNTVELPKSGAYYMLSADPDIEFENDAMILTTPLHTWEKKTVVVFNVPAGTKTGLLQANTTIADRSALQQGLDSIAAQAGAVANLVSQLTPVGALIQQINGLPHTSKVTVTEPQALHNTRSTQLKDNSVLIEIKSLDITGRIHPGDNVEAMLKLKQGLEKKCAYDETLFNKYLAHLKYNSKESLDESVDNYMSAVDELVANSLLADSVRSAFLVNIFVNSSMPTNTKLEAKKVEGSKFQTKILRTDESDDPIKKKVSVYTLKGDTTVLKTFHYKIGKNYRFQLGAGLAYTFQNYYQSTANVNKGQVTISNSIQQFRFVAGLNTFVGPNGLFLQDNKFWGNWKERLSIFTGVGIPEPLKNIYIGPSYDLWPGLRVTTGVHIVEANKYEITNNIITQNRLQYKPAGIFVALVLDPSSVVSTITNFKK